MTNATRPYGDPATAKVLFIGHDPRLQQSDTVAQYAFFADHYFTFATSPTYGPQQAKYGLAKAVFDYVDWLTSGRYRPDQVLLTNLCNAALSHAPKHQIVYIPEAVASDGLAAIRALLAQSQVEVIFATSQQVNYWLGKLGFYDPGAEFLRDSEPVRRGVANNQPYFAPKVGRAFTHICGRRFVADGRWTLYPVLHVKNWPMKGKVLKGYGVQMEGCRSMLLENSTRIHD